MCVNVYMSVVQCKGKYFKKVCLRDLVNNMICVFVSLNSVKFTSML